MPNQTGARSVTTPLAKYGDPPGAELEQRILKVYQHHPAAFSPRSNRSVTATNRERCAHSGLSSPSTSNAKQAAANTNPVLAGSDREKKIARAEQWMRAAGIHFDQPAEVLDELFGDRGQLRAWKDDTFLQQRMHTLWMELRPTGEQIEADMLERAKHWQATTGGSGTPAPNPVPLSTPTSRSRSDG